MSHREWFIAPHDPEVVQRLAQELHLPWLVAQVLATRGCRTPHQGQIFLQKKLSDLHDPELMHGISDAANHLLLAITERRKITVYGDYDADGITATSLLWHVLRLAGGAVDYYIPSRLDEGYGLNAEALRQFAAEDPHRLIVTVDCGIASVREVALARELGMDLIVTDHHQRAEHLPPANVIVHPALGEQYPFSELCGVGVAFKLAWALCTRLGDGKKASPRMREFLLSAIGLVALGTLADAVPLQDENRILVHYGLKALKQRSSPGLQELMRLSKLHERPELLADDVVYELCPRLNAVGRLGQARLAVEMLTTEDEARAQELARYLHELNSHRKSLENKTLKQARELIEQHWEGELPAAIVLHHTEWHAGIIGIVAARLAEQYRRPIVLIAPAGADGLAQGSVRSYGEVDVHAALSACRQHLVRYGGHTAAAGLKIEPGNIEPFRETFAHIVAAQGQSSQQHPYYIDAEVRFADLTPRAIEALERLGPFGRGQPRPLLASTHVQLAAPPRKVGEGERHLSLLLKQENKTRRAIAFGRGDWAEEMAQHEWIRICYQPQLDYYQGEVRVQLRLLDWYPDTPPSRQTLE